jgi:histidinol phosphatase-like enzyme
MLRRAAREHGLDLARSWVIGDILDDIEAGR